MWVDIQLSGDCVSGTKDDLMQFVYQSKSRAKAGLILPQDFKQHGNFALV